MDDLEVKVSEDQRKCQSTESFDSGFQPNSQLSDSSPSAAASSKEDALEIYQRYIAPDCPYPVPLDTSITQNVVQGICTESGLPDPTSFDDAQSKIVELLDNEYFQDFLNSEGHAKHLVDVLTGGGVTMGDILYHDELLFHFREFMEGEGDRDLLEFWMAANNFRRQNLRQETDQLTRDAMVIYERFVSMQATSPLGVSDKMRCQIEEAICCESGIVQPNCFDRLLALVIRVLQEKHLAPFLRSNLYKKFLSELFCRIQTSPYPKQHQPQNQRRRSFFSRMKRSGSNSSLSTCSSSDVTGFNSSISSQNTLLATGTTNGKALNNKDSELDLFDPDSIWKRKSHSIVNIGRIDGLGRYTSSFEKPPIMTSSASSDSIKSSSSKLTRAVKRLVSSEIDEAQEEMAWQMAEMIVSDVMEVNSCQRISEEEEEENKS